MNTFLNKLLSHWRAGFFFSKMGSEVFWQPCLLIGREFQSSAWRKSLLGDALYPSGGVIYYIYTPPFESWALPKAAYININCSDQRPENANISLHQGWLILGRDQGYFAVLWVHFTILSYLWGLVQVFMPFISVCACFFAPALFQILLCCCFSLTTHLGTRRTCGCRWCISLHQSNGLHGCLWRWRKGNGRLRCSAGVLPFQRPRRPCLHSF